MASKEITKTWWGKKWLDALKGVYYTNRIGRGKTYANIVLALLSISTKKALSSRANHKHQAHTPNSSIVLHSL